MKKALRAVIGSAVLALMATVAFSQSATYAPGSFSGWSDVQQFANFQAKTITAVAATGSQTVQLDTCYFALAEGPAYWFPLAVGVKVQILDPSGTQTNSNGSSETVTITAVQTPTLAPGSTYPTGYACGFTASFSNTHPLGIKVVSADKGVGEAVSVLSAQGGTLVVTPQSGVTTSMITGLNFGSTKVSIVDISGANATAPVTYCYNGTTYAPCLTPLMTANGASLVPFYSETNVTLSTTATTTAVGTATFIPPLSIVLGVTGRVTTAITGSCTGWEIGDTTTAARFTANNTGLTLGTTASDTGAFLTTGIASATTGLYSAAGEALQITCAGGDPTAGAIRVSAFGYTLSPAAQ